ncbi:MAG: HTH domain-containing protein [Candidatus Melainabacteria bacterium]|nr:HTH domain-containing protein [Candidatus Melainabacteria bacterium]
MRQKRLPQKLNQRQRGEKIRDEILRLLKLNEELSVQNLCDRLLVTDTAVRRHLEELKTSGLIQTRLDQSKTGRPSQFFSTTETAREFFPSGFEELANDLLDTICGASGHRGVLDVVLANNERLIAVYSRQYSGLELEERVAAIAKYYNDSGYMTNWFKQKDGSFFLYHQNCAIYSLAKKYRQFCLAELIFIERILDAKVSRSHYIFNENQPVCGYVITRKDF